MRILERTAHGVEWWDLAERVAEVAVTSEDPDHPVDRMLAGGPEWRAAEPGEQTMRVTFDEPRNVSRIFLRFVEKKLERTQELGIQWSGEDGKSFHHLLRQQWNFSPHGSTEEVEDCHVKLSAVSAIELTIRPGRPDAIASLAEFKLA